jgi:hypothetical protein
LSFTSTLSGDGIHAARLDASQTLQARFVAIGIDIGNSPAGLVGHARLPC